MTRKNTARFSLFFLRKSLAFRFQMADNHTMAYLGGNSRKGGRKRTSKYQKLYRKGEGSTFELKDASGKGTGKWRGVVTYRDANDFQQRKYFSGRSESEVRDKMRDWEARAGRKLNKEEWTVADLFEHLLSEPCPDYPKGGQFVQDRRQKPNTIFDYRSQWRRHIKPRIGHLKASAVEGHHVEQVLRELRNAEVSPLSARTARNIKCMLSTCFKAGVRIKALSANPVKDTEPIKIPRYRASILGLEGMMKLAAAAEGQPIYAPILLAGYCGLREGEIAGLMHTDFDAAAKTLKVEKQYQQLKGGGLAFSDPKSESGNRLIPVPPIVADALSALPRTSLYMFPHSRDSGRPIHPTALWKGFQAVLVKCGMPKIRFHDLRHSANNILKQLGVPAVTRRDILGHSTIAVTENVYTQTVDAEMIDAMDRITQALAKQNGEPQKSAQAQAADA
jgi:integrase